MDFMKVLDQTVREIKREVNLKVLKIPEIEQKVLDATDNEPWGPHGTALTEIAQATKKFTECQMVMNVLWTRLGETGKDWRYVYKALTVIEYLIANGSEQVVDDIVEHTFQISSLTGFEYVEPNGKDMGINVRKKAEKIVSLLNDKDKIQEARNKAASNREKYVGLSSTGMTYKSSSASYSGSSFQGSSRYGGFSGRYDSDSYKNKDEDRYEKEKFEKFVPKSRPQNSRDRDSISPSRSAQTQIDEYSTISPQGHGDQIDDVDDDFDPRGTTASKPPIGKSQQVGLFGESLIGDLLDAPTSVPSQSGAANVESSDADLFADADFVSAAPEVDAKENIDLFEAKSGSSTTVASTMDFFASPDPVIPETKSQSIGPLNSSSNFVDPFAAIPMNSFDGSGDVFGAFTSHTEQPNSAFTPNPLSSATTTNEMSGKSISESKVSSKKDAFQVKSGIWADSLSRGLIDLNISAPKKVNLADVGIVGLSDGSEEKQKGPATSIYMGSLMGSSIGRTGGADPNGTIGDDFFSSFTTSSQYQFGDFQK